MTTFTAREIFGVFLVLVTGLFALAAWHSFYAMSLSPNSANTLLALAWFTLASTSFVLGTVIWRDDVLPGIASVLLFLPSFLFIHSWYHIGFCILSSILAFWSTGVVKKEIEERLHFHFVKSIRAGQFFFVAALALALSSGYFIALQKTSWEELITRFRLSEGVAVTLFKVVGYFDPSLKDLSQENITVDQFLESLEKSKRSDTSVIITESSDGSVSSRPEDILAAFPELRAHLEESGIDVRSVGSDILARELFLRSGREQIGLLIGRPVFGDEKISSVFSLAIQQKIITLLEGGGKTEHLPPQSVAFILSVLLFLTLLPLGSFLGFVWVTLAWLIFKVVLAFKWLSLVHLSQEQETLGK